MGVVSEKSGLDGYADGALVTHDEKFRLWWTAQFNQAAEVKGLVPEVTVLPATQQIHIVLRWGTSEAQQTISYASMRTHNPAEFVTVLLESVIGRTHRR